MNPQMMFLVNFLTSMAQLAGQTHAPYQFILNVPEGSKERETAFETISKIHRALDIVLDKMDSNDRNENRKNVIQLVANNTADEPEPA